MLRGPKAAVDMRESGCGSETNIHCKLAQPVSMFLCSTMVRGGHSATDCGCSSLDIESHNFEIDGFFVLEKIK